MEGKVFTIPTENVVSFEIPLTTKNEVTKTLFEGQIKKLTIKRYWDSHGEKVWWKAPETLENVNVKIISEEYDQAYGKDVTDPNEFEHWEDWTLYVDDKEISGECMCYRGAVQMTVEICDGHG